MKNILIINRKGGVGKTLVADELAFALDAKNVPYCFYDLDGQGGTLHEPVEMDNADISIIDTPGSLQGEMDYSEFHNAILNCLNKELIEDKWVDIVMKQSGDDTCQWVNPEEHLSYQMPQKPFEIFEEDFRKTAMDYIMFQKGIDTKDFGERLLNKVMYSSKVEADDKTVTISMEKGGTRSEKD